MTTAGDAARSLRMILEKETAAILRADIDTQSEIAWEKSQALTAFTATKPLMSSEDAPELEALITAAEENRLALAAAEAGLKALEERLRDSLRGAADAGTYGPTRKTRGRHTLAASIDTSA